MYTLLRLNKLNKIRTLVTGVDLPALVLVSTLRQLGVAPTLAL
jgi:hypothetical protein